MCIGMIIMRRMATVVQLLLPTRPIQRIQLSACGVKSGGTYT
jgi:hypothetical protein